MYVALRDKRYYASMKREYGDPYYEKKYREACQVCVKACENLFDHYTDRNTIKGE